MNNISYVLREGFAGLGRNITMTIALVITTAISLALLGTGVLVSQMTADTKEIYLDRVEVMVQLNEEVSASDADCSQEACREVRDTLEAQDGVESVTFRSRAQSYERFVEVFGETDPLLVEETSPDALPAALHVRLEDPTDPAPLQAVAGMPQVDQIVDQTEDVRGATSNLDAIRTATFILAVIQAVAALFLIVNMVQISAFQRRDQVSLMRLVGASRWFTQAPFVIEAMVATFIGAVVSVGGMLLGKRYVIDPAVEGLVRSQLIAPITTADIWAVMPWVGLAGVVFSGLAAYVTLRAYVRQ